MKLALAGVCLLVLSACGGSNGTAKIDVSTSGVLTMVGSDCLLSTPSKDRAPGRSYTIGEVVSAFEAQGFRVKGRLQAELAHRLRAPALLTVDNAELRPSRWEGDLLSFYVYPSAEMAARAAECFGRKSEYLRKGNVEIWTKLAASPKVVVLARRALEILPA